MSTIERLKRENADLRARPASRTKLWGGEGVYTRTGGPPHFVVAYHIDGESRCHPQFRPEFSAHTLDCLDAPEWTCVGGVHFSHYGDGGEGVAFASGTRA